MPVPHGLPRPDDDSSVRQEPLRLYHCIAILPTKNVPRVVPLRFSARNGHQCNAHVSMLILLVAHPFKGKQELRPIWREIHDGETLTVGLRKFVISCCACLSYLNLCRSLASSRVATARPCNKCCSVRITSNVTSVGATPEVFGTFWSTAVAQSLLPLWFRRDFGLGHTLADSHVHRTTNHDEHDSAFEAVHLKLPEC